MIDVERVRSPLRQVDACAQPRGKFEQPDRTIGAGNDKAARLEFDVAWRSLKHLGGNLPAAFSSAMTN